MKKLFTKYFQLREETGAKPSDGGSGGPKTDNITSKIKLQKKEGSKEFAPFTINRTMHPNLRTLIKAFSDSDKVGVGYTTIDKTKGETEPNLKKKTLYLTGGAVRDHLKGKTPRNYDIVTDATPSEMRMILTQPEAQFTETKPREGDYASDERYAHLPSPGHKNKIFYASRWDKQGKELEITAEINGEQFHIATLSKHPKSRRVQPDKGEAAATIEDDAANRDFTINSLYIPLTTSDGDNTELIDPHGGAHHLKNGEVRAIGDDLTPRLSEDPTTALRYIKLLTRYGNPDQIPDKYAHAISRFKDMADVPKDHVRKEFLSGLEHPDSDPRKYLGAFHKTGLLGSVFPGAQFNPDEMPEDFRGDRWLAPAWIMRDNDPEQVKKTLLGQGWSKQEANDIAYLVKMYQWGAKNKFDSKDFYDIKSAHTGLTKSKIREFMQMAKAHGPEIDSFLSHDDSDLSPYTKGPDGKRGVNPEYIKFLGRPPQGHEFESVKKNLSTKRWKDSLNKLKRHGSNDEEQHGPPEKGGFGHHDKGGFPPHKGHHDDDDGGDDRGFHGHDDEDK
jgi:tRNA nucleotidyltransferase/poly(A) polymerase